jgi:hypothetical protein
VKKTRGRKSRATVPLKCLEHFLILKNLQIVIQNLAVLLFSTRFTGIMICICLVHHHCNNGQVICQESATEQRNFPAFFFLLVIQA